MKYFSLIILFLAVVVASCEKELFCGDAKTEGIIVESISFGGCLNYFPDTIFIIESEDELDTLYKYETCPGRINPEINFEAYTLLGQYADGGGCDITFNREVVADEPDKRYVYTVSVKECGLCEMMGYSMNWVLVPKLPDNWTVKFKIDYN